MVILHSAFIVKDVLSYHLTMSSYTTMDRLDDWRNQIDLLDEILIETLSKRMDISLQIGEYKNQKGIAILQPERYRAMMIARQQQATSLGLSHDFIDSLFDLIHQESQRKQRKNIGGENKNGGKE